jgi:hypothetical protein
MYGVLKNYIKLVTNTTNKSLSHRLSNFLYEDYTEIPSNSKILIYASDTSNNPFSNKSLVGDEKLVNEADALELSQLFKNRSNFIRMLGVKASSLNPDLPVFDDTAYKYGILLTESALNFRLSSYFS